MTFPVIFHYIECLLWCYYTFLVVQRRVRILNIFETLFFPPSKFNSCTLSMVTGNDYIERGYDTSTKVCFMNKSELISVITLRIASKVFHYEKRIN